MQAEQGSNEFPTENDGFSRKSWQTPEVEVLLVDQTENFLGSSGNDGPLFTS